MLGIFIPRITSSNISPYFSTGCCYFLSSAINPFLYSLLSKRFRRGFHDLTHKVVKNWRNRSSTASRENQNAHRQALAQASTLPNNFSFCFKNRQVNNRNVLKRHFNLPNTSVVQSDYDSKMHQNLEFEMQGVKNKNLSNSLGYKSSSDGLSASQSKQVPVDKLNYKDVEEIAALLNLKKKQLNCKYKVVFRSNLNQKGTTLIINTSKAEKNIPRCSGIHDLRYVGTNSTSTTSSSVIYLHGGQALDKNLKFNSVAEERSNKNKLFLSTLSYQSCREV